MAHAVITPSSRVIANLPPDDRGEQYVGEKFKEMIVKLPVGLRRVEINIVVDTGSQRSFINRTMYETMIAQEGKKGSTATRMFGIGGSELDISGQVKLSLSVCTKEILNTFLIAEIEEDAI